MNISSNVKLYNSENSFQSSPSFGAAKDITLEYVLKHRERLLPERIRRKAKIFVSKKDKIKTLPTLKQLHESTYSKLLECNTLSAAQNFYPEFKEILQVNVVLSKTSKNIKKIEEKVPLKDLSLYILKERWGKMKTLNEIAQQLGLKDRSALGWVLEKIQMPDLGKNYQALLKASDEEGNRIIASKVKAFNSQHRDLILAHNRQIAQNARNKALNSMIAKEAWKRLSHVQDALKEFSKTTNSEERFAEFWAQYPQYAKEFGEMKKIVSEEIKQSAK